MRLLSYTNRNDSVMFRSFYYLFCLHEYYMIDKEKNNVINFAPWLFRMDDEIRSWFDKGILTMTYFLNAIPKKKKKMSTFYVPS